MMRQSLNALDAATPWWVKLLVPVLVSSIITFGATYTKSDKDTSNRVVALEVHQQDQEKRLDRIEHKLDLLLEWGPGLGNNGRTTPGAGVSNH